MKIKNYLKLLLLPALCAAILLPAGCATDNNGSTAGNPPPPKKDQSIADRLKVGMTKDEVRQALGNPKGTTVTSQGTEIWQYNDSEKAWIPFYAISGGKFKFTIINFDGEGKVKDWSASDHSLF